MSGAFSRNKGRVGVRVDFGRPLSHGHCVRRKESPTYKTWMMMRTRCNNPNYDGFADYGGRGVKVCERWNVFENFLEDMGERPEGTSIDRIDVDGNYEPGNCRWADKYEQGENMRPGRYWLFGKYQTVRAALRDHAGEGVTLGMVRRRVHRLGWDRETAISTPKMPAGRPWKGTGYGR